LLAKPQNGVSLAREQGVLVDMRAYSNVLETEPFQLSNEYLALLGGKLRNRSFQNLGQCRPRIFFLWARVARRNRLNGWAAAPADPLGVQWEAR